MEKLPLIVALEEKVLFPEPESIRLLNVNPEAARVCAPAAPKFTVPDAGANTLPIPFHAVALTLFSLSVLLPPFSDPAVKVISPVKVCVNALPRFKVPPIPLMVSAAPFTFPVKVAVPPVLDIETVPVVVKEPILWVAVPEMVTPPVVPLAVPPLLTRFPPKVSK